MRQVHTVFTNRDELSAVLAQRRADLSRAKSDLDRRKSLGKTGAVSAEEISHAQESVNAAQQATRFIPFILVPSTGCLLSGVRNAPNRTRAIIAHQERTVRCRRNSDWPAPNAFVIHHKAGQKIFIFARRVPRLVERDTNQLIARSG